MRKEITLDPTGGKVTVNVLITGVVAAGYYLQLYEKMSNNVIFDYSGNNEYDNDDARELPNTAEANILRVITLDTSIFFLQDDPDQECAVNLEVFQGNTLVDVARDVVRYHTQTVNSFILVKFI